jgi:hypothetical protein
LPRNLPSSPFEGPIKKTLDWPAGSSQADPRVDRELHPGQDRSYLGTAGSVAVTAFLRAGGGLTLAALPVLEVEFFGCPCTLSGSGASASCEVFFTSFPRGGQAITASYGGDATDGTSTGITLVAVEVPVVSTSVDAVTCSSDGSRAIVFGTAKLNGSGSVEYRIDFQLAAWERGKDTYRIRLSSGYDSGAQPIRNGDLDIHLRDRDHQHHDANSNHYRVVVAIDGG